MRPKIFIATSGVRTHAVISLPGLKSSYTMYRIWRLSMVKFASQNQDHSAIVALDDKETETIVVYNQNILKTNY
jgi:hypothetical protein